MFGDIEQKEIDNYKDRNEISENIIMSTKGRNGSRYLDRVLTKLPHGPLYHLRYRVTSKKNGSFIFDTFTEAVEEYNKQ